MNADAYLDLRGIARYLGLTYATVRGYHGHASQRRANAAHGVTPGPLPGDLPRPDRYYRDRIPEWTVATVDQWRESQPGRGAGGGRPRADATR